MREFVARSSPSYDVLARVLGTGVSAPLFTRPSILPTLSALFNTLRPCTTEKAAADSLWEYGPFLNSTPSFRLYGRMDSFIAPEVVTSVVDDVMHLQYENADLYAARTADRPFALWDDSRCVRHSLLESSHADGVCCLIQPGARGC